MCRYVVFSFPSSLFIERYGLRAGLILGAWLQALGCYLRWYDRGGPLLDTGWLCYLRLGQLVASLGQAFFVNPPPMMAAQWFGNDQRVLATTVGVNANTLGIAGAYILGSLLVRTAADIDRYLFVIFVLSFALAALTTLFYPSAPPTPPSFSEHHKHHRVARHAAFSPRTILGLFSYSGFVHTCIGFAVAEASINALSAFMSDILTPMGYSSVFVGVTATTFIVMCMVGSAIVGYAVDRWRVYVSAVCGCLVVSAVSLVGLGYLRSAVLTVGSVVALGFFLGPVQPLVIETAVECTYPSPSSTVAAVQQVLGNVVSALLFPLMAWLRNEGKGEEGGMEPVLLLMAVVLALTAVVYSTFKGGFRRLLHETEGFLERRPSEMEAEAEAAAALDVKKAAMDERDALLLHSPGGNGVGAVGGAGGSVSYSSIGVYAPHAK